MFARIFTILAVVPIAAPARADTRLGLMADVGAPDGANASLVYQPIRVLRVSGGIGHNYISRGVRAGLTIVPVSWYVTPTLSADYGHYPEGDANHVARMISGDSSFSSPVLEKVGYDYANAQLGLEFGRDRFTFYVRGGVTRISSEIHLESLMDPDSSVTFSESPTTTIWTVSARIGLVVYLMK